MMENQAIYGTKLAAGIMAGGGLNPKQEREVPGELSRLMCQTDRLHTVLNELEERLATVRHSRPSGLSNVEKSKELVPLAEGLKSLADRVAGACYRIDELIQTIEL